MNKDKVLKESVRKLLSLNISDKEILTNLKDVGVDLAEARRILEETKAEKGKLPKKSAPYEEALRAAEEMAAARAKEREEKAAGVSANSEESKGDIAKLWEKGILATVDSKLEEMQSLKKDIDSIIDLKIRAQLDKEVKKIEVLFDSQRTLLVGKVDAGLEQKKKDVTEVIEARMAEIKKIGDLTDMSLRKIEAQNKFSSEMVKTINEKLAELDSTKSKIISGMNASLIENNSKVEEMLNAANVKQGEIDTRINRAIELESKITEGLLKDAEAKIDKMALAKTDELAVGIRKKLRELEVIEKSVNPKAITKKLEEMDAAKLELAKASDAERAKIKSNNALQSTLLKKQLEKQVDEMFKSRQSSWDMAVKAKVDEISGLKKEVDIEEIKATMDSLDLFKRQFVKVVEKKVIDFNKAKKDVSATLKMREKAIDEHITAIDAKMAELDLFEKNFAEEMGLAVDKLTVDKNKSKKTAKKANPKQK